MALRSRTIESSPNPRVTARQITEWVAFMRASTDKQELARQKRALQLHAQRMGVKVVKTFEAHETGTSLDEAKVARQLIGWLRQNHRSTLGLWVDTQSRLTRGEEKDLSEWIALLRETGTLLISKETDAYFNLENSRDRFQFRQQASTDRRWVEELHEMCDAGRAVKALAALHVTGCPCYGLVKIPSGPDRGKRKKDDTPAGDSGLSRWQVVRLIHEQYAGGKTVSKVAKELAVRGIPSPRGNGRWNKNTIQKMLNHPLYRGISFARCNNHVRTPRGTETIVWQPDSPNAIWIEDAWKPDADGPQADPPRTTRPCVERIIEPELAERVANWLKANYNKTTADPSMLTGILVCPHCLAAGRRAKTKEGRPDYITYQVGSTIKGRRVYVCRGRRLFKNGCDAPYLPREELDGLIWERFREAFPEGRPSRLQIETGQDRAARYHTEVDKIERQMIAAEEKLQRARMKLIDSSVAFDDKDFNAVKASVDRELAGLKTKLMAYDLACDFLDESATARTGSRIAKLLSGTEFEVTVSGTDAEQLLMEVGGIEEVITIPVLWSSIAPPHPDEANTAVAPDEISKPTALSKTPDAGLFRSVVWFAIPSDDRFETVEFVTFMGVRSATRSTGNTLRHGLRRAPHRGLPDRHVLFQAIDELGHGRQGLLTMA